MFGSTQRALPATLLITSPQIGICVTSEDAKYQYSWGTLRPEIGTFSYSPLDQTPLAPRIVAPRAATPGDLVRIEILEADGVDSVVAQILGPQQRSLSQGVGFSPFGHNDRWVVLIGVSALTGHSSYILSVTVKAGDRSALQLSPLLVRERTFRFERIALTADLEQLRTSVNPRKVAEARELARVLTTPHLDALFETGPIRNPFPDARRTSGYGDRREYIYPDNTSDYSVHEGLDLAAPEGTPIAACGRGRIVFAEQRIITGNTVVIEHLPGLFSLYFHLSEIDTKAGDVVAQGDVIGKVGQTGFATGPHLHWEIDELGVPVDPDALAEGPILDKTFESGEIENNKAPKGGE
jgi:murein DD-endopeptidase MepM/ murein hydrolase activator NlpD